MLKIKKSLKHEIGNRPIVIWGARMTGLGLVRFAKAEQINVLGFIDSDSALIGRKINGILVHKPNDLTKLERKNPNLILVVAVSIKESEIMAKLKSDKIDHLKTVIYSNFSDVFYTIDIVGTCNLKCLSCAHSIENHNVPRGVMPYRDFVDVVDKIVKDSQLLTHVSLYSWGEPLLHPNVGQIVKHLHDRNIAVALSSNLSIKFNDRLDSVIQQSPEYLKVSTSGFYPAAYNNTHQGGDVNLVKSNLYRLRYLIDKYKANTVVDVNYHLYRDNNGVNLQKMKDLCSELGFILSTVYALVMPLERVIEHCDGNPDHQTKKLSQNLLVDIDEGISASKNRGAESGKCGFRENQVNINSDLTVPVCCTVFNREGNIVAENFLKSTPENIRHKKNHVETCKKCIAFGLPAYNMGYNRQSWEKIAARKKSSDKESRLNLNI